MMMENGSRGATKTHEAGLPQLGAGTDSTSRKYEHLQGNLPQDVITDSSFRPPNSHAAASSSVTTTSNAEITAESDNEVFQESKGRSTLADFAHSQGTVQEVRPDGENQDLLKTNVAYEADYLDEVNVSGNTNKPACAHAATSAALEPLLEDRKRETETPCAADIGPSSAGRGREASQQGEADEKLNAYPNHQADCSSHKAQEQSAKEKVGLTQDSQKGLEDTEQPFYQSKESAETGRSSSDESPTLYPRDRDEVLANPSFAETCKKTAELSQTVTVSSRDESDKEPMEKSSRKTPFKDSSIATEEMQSDKMSEKMETNTRTKQASGDNEATLSTALKNTSSRPTDDACDTLRARASTEIVPEAQQEDTHVKVIRDQGETDLKRPISSDATSDGEDISLSCGSFEAKEESHLRHSHQSHQELSTVRTSVEKTEQCPELLGTGCTTQCSNQDQRPEDSRSAYSDLNIVLHTGLEQSDTEYESDSVRQKLTLNNNGISDESTGFTPAMDSLTQGQTHEIHQKSDGGYTMDTLPVYTEYGSKGPVQESQPFKPGLLMASDNESSLPTTSVFKCEYWNQEPSVSHHIPQTLLTKESGGFPQLPTPTSSRPCAVYYVSHCDNLNINQHSCKTSLYTSLNATGGELHGSRTYHTYTDDFAKTREAGGASLESDAVEPSISRETLTAMPHIPDQRSPRKSLLKALFCCGSRKKSSKRRKEKKNQ